MIGEDPVAPDESVLRRIHKNNTRFGGAELIVLRPAFAPNDEDTDGISLYRERYTSIDSLVAAARSPGAVYVARLTVAEVRELGLSLDITKGDLPGHVSIPELSFKKCNLDRTTKDLQKQLADLATQRIVHTPPLTADPLSPSPV
jgi:hypothetical protein